MANASSAKHASAEPLELEALKAKRWPTKGKAERISRALEALHEPVPDFNLTALQWKQIAEDPDLGEE